MLGLLPQTDLVDGEERWPPGIEMSVENVWEIRNDEVATRLLGHNAAVGTVRLLVLTLIYIVASVLIVSSILR